MIKTYFFILCSFLCTSCYSFVHLDGWIYPENFFLKKRVYSLHTTFDLQVSGKAIGSAYGLVFTMLPEYHLLDTEEKIIAKSRMRGLKWTKEFELKNDKDIPIGSICKAAFSLFPAYDLLSPSQELLGTLSRNMLGTVWTLYDPISGHPILTLSRPMFKPDWKGEVLNDEHDRLKEINPHMLFTVIAYEYDLYIQSHSN